MEMTQGVGSEKTKGRITAKYTNPTGEQEVKVMGPVATIIAACR